MYGLRMHLDTKHRWVGSKWNALRKCFLHNAHLHTLEGFDFLGYRFGGCALGLAGKTVENFLEKCSRLYEQKGHLPKWKTALESYHKRWWRWCTAGLDKETVTPPYDAFCNLFLRFRAV